MKLTAITVVAGGVVLGAIACSSGTVPIGDGLGQTTGALGGLGQPPKADGSCDVRLTSCAGACLDLSGDNAHCGTCGNACAGSDTCVSSVCAAPAPPADAGQDSAPDSGAPCDFGQDSCGGACIDVLFDKNNCGACGVTCSGATSCLRGSCM